MSTEQKPRGRTPPADREQKRWISQQEILLIAMRAAAVIEEELNAVKEAGVMFLPELDGGLDWQDATFCPFG